MIRDQQPAALAPIIDAADAAYADLYIPAIREELISICARLDAERVAANGWGADAAKTRAIVAALGGDADAIYLVQYCYSTGSSAAHSGRQLGALVRVCRAVLDGRSPLRSCMHEARGGAPDRGMRSRGRGAFACDGNPCGPVNR